MRLLILLAALAVSFPSWGPVEPEPTTAVPLFGVWGLFGLSVLAALAGSIGLARFRRKK